MKKYWFSLLLVSGFFTLRAQPVLSDSLQKILYNSADDSNKVKRLRIAITYLPYTQSDSALYYADSIIRLSEKISYDYGLAHGYMMKSQSYLYKGDYSRVIFYIYQQLNLFKALGDVDGVFHAYYQLSELYNELGDYKKALEYKLKGRELIISVGDSIYDRLEGQFQRTSALMYFHDYNIALSYLNAGMIDSAAKYGHRAFAARNSWSVIPVLMGDIYSMKKDYATALKYYNTPTAENYPVDSVKNYIGKAKVFSRIKQPDSCRTFALLALDISQRINFAKGVLQASDILSALYEESDPQEYLKYIKISNAIKDSLYNIGKINQVNNIAFNDELRKLDAIAAEKAARNRFKIWSLFGIMFTLLVTGILLWRNNQQKKRANRLLQREKQTVEQTLEKLKSTQSQLIHSEKMASLGELTAGIAHEIQNPLNFVNNFSEVSNEMFDEMKEELATGNRQLATEIADAIKQNLEKINHHGKRADAIVKGMLHHSKQTSGIKEPTDINALCDEYLRLSYHGLRAKDKSFNTVPMEMGIKTDFDESIGKINIVPQDIGRVFLNLFNNAFYAVHERQKEKSLMLNAKDSQYLPMVTVVTKKLEDKVEIIVKDNGNGIPQNIIDKIFQPFFTTKPTGQGTGLGLSLAYDIITKEHNGTIKVKSGDGKGSEFIIILPD